MLQAGPLPRAGRQLHPDEHPPPLPRPQLLHQLHHLLLRRERVPAEVGGTLLQEITLNLLLKWPMHWGTFYLLIAEFFASYNIVGAKELVVFLCLSGDI